ncbi:hypothetical protein LO772_31510 [Yinghuangia sp. ASG 101]|nr:hypothetical protein [Yinghuangia sp. ASG 101]UGQ11280.1 hypothetical protein LO772_31510 [Yinghuangia sp. ASG 101]
MSDTTIRTAATEEADGLLVTRRQVLAARSRTEQMSDGGSSGVSDTND